MVVYSSSSFLIIGCTIANKKYCAGATTGPSEKASRNFFRTTYGSSPEVCAHTWEYIRHHETLPEKALPKYLLWALMFMKTYNTETHLAGLVGVTEKTFRKWVWLLITSISEIYNKVILWKNRLEWDANNKFCKITTDGTDFRINEPKPFNKRWFSHKFKSAGLRYEVSLSINGGNIVWTNGPYPCGSWPDISIFRDGLMQKLKKGEMTEADRGYRGQPDKIRLPSDWITEEEKNMKRMARARHEHVNGRFKNYKILKLPFRHDLEQHQKVFRSVCVLTQLAINSGESLWLVEYK